MSSRGNTLHRNAVIDDGIVVDRRVVDNRRPVINVADVRHRQSAMTQLAVSEVVQAHECMMLGAQPEIEIEPNIDSVEPEPAPSHKLRSRRQRSPTTG